MTVDCCDAAIGSSCFHVIVVVGPVRLVACSCGSCNREDSGVRGSGPRNVNFLNGPKIISD